MVLPKQRSGVWADNKLAQQQLLQPQQHQKQIQKTRHNASWYNGSAFSMFFLSLFFLVQRADALSCYETINGKTSIRQNDTWQYCSLVPNVDHGQEHINGIRFGVGPENDGVEAYQSAFRANEDQYRVLTVCIYERYDFSKFLGRLPDTAVEFAFRCVCNYDLCNSEATFHHYLKMLKQESYIVKK